MRVAKRTCGCNSMCFCVLGCVLAGCFVVSCFEGWGLAYVRNVCSMGTCLTRP